MASRYWVGGADYWNGTAGTKWAATSGGTGGASNPTSSDDVFFDANSGAVAVGVNATVNCRHINFTGFTGSFQTFSTLNVYGNVNLGTTVSMPLAGLTIRAPSTITSNGHSGGTITVNTGSASDLVSLADHLTLASTLTLTAGHFDANDKNVTVARVIISGTSTRTLSMGSGTWTLANASQTTIWDAGTTTNLTFNKETANFSLVQSTSATRTFHGGGLTYNNLTDTAVNFGTRLTFTGANTFADFTINPRTGTGDRTLRFPSGQTTTFTGTVTLVGASSSRRINIESSTGGSPATLSKASGTVSGDWLEIEDSTATGGATWDAGANSIDAGGNSGWFPVVVSNGFFALF